MTSGLVDRPRWFRARLKMSVKVGRSGGTIIKGEMPDQAADNLFPGYSASGQDVWVYDAHYRNTPGIVVSAVGARCGKCFKADGDWTAIANTMVLIPRANFYRDYLWYVFNDERFWEKGGTAQPYIRIAESLDREWLFPSYDEQKKITEFLDRETAEADALIAKYERLLDLLEEKRVALITQTATKGLDPNVPMKDSGVKWIGEVPCDSTVIKIKYVTTKIGSGVTPKGGADVYQSLGVSFIRSQNVYDDGLHLDDITYISDELDAEMERTRLKSGDVLLNITGASIGRTCVVVPEVLPANVNQHVCVIRPAMNIESNYLSLCLKASIVKQQILSLENGSSREGLNYGQVGNLVIVAPKSIEKQRAIVDIVATKLEGLGRLIERTQRAIALVYERRSALITAAVTGQIDVTTYKSGHVTAVA